MSVSFRLLLALFQQLTVFLTRARDEDKTILIEFKNTSLVALHVVIELCYLLKCSVDLGSWNVGYGVICNGFAILVVNRLRDIIPLPIVKGRSQNITSSRFAIKNLRSPHAKAVLNGIYRAATC